MTTVLLVEDEPGLADSLKTELEFSEMQVILAGDGKQALDYFAQYETQIDLIILDWMLPKVDGFSVLRRIRKTSQVPIIMLTARSYIGDKVAGLTGGADDYLTKPFEIEELLARIEVALRHGHLTQPVEQNSTFQIGDLTIDDDTKRVQRGTRLLSLTPREYSLLLALAQNRDQACSRDELLDQVWGVDFIGQPNIVDVYIRQLRHKIDGDPKLPRLIHTIRGIGYMLSANLDDE